MALVIAGDVRGEEAVEMAERWFGDWNRVRRPFAASSKEPRRNRGKRIVLEKDFKETYLAMAAPAPGILDEDGAIACDVLEIILGGGQSSRLHQRLVEDKRLAHGVSAGYGAHQRDGLFFLSAALDGDKLDAFRAEALAEFERFKSEGPTERELQRAKTMIFTSEAFSTETTTGRSGNAGYLYTLTGSTDMEKTYLERLRGVTAADVAQAARECLAADAFNEVVVKPRSGGAESNGGSARG
jgi:zinc protease